MDIWEAMQRRHSVRRYTSAPIDTETLTKLTDLILLCREKSGLDIRLFVDEPKAFSGKLAHYGSFHQVRNYITLGAEKSAANDEKIGFFGEKIVLAATTYGLQSCWVGLTYSKKKIPCHFPDDISVRCVIALGHGETPGSPRPTKSIEALSATEVPMPEWFRRGMQAVQLAPTAINQQRFRFTLREGSVVSAKALPGFFSKVDLGIAKYHFLLGAGKGNFIWERNDFPEE